MPAGFKYSVTKLCLVLKFSRPVLQFFLHRLRWRRLKEICWRWFRTDWGRWMRSNTQWSSAKWVLRISILTVVGYPKAQLWVLWICNISNCFNISNWPTQNSKIYTLYLTTKCQTCFCSQDGKISPSLSYIGVTKRCSHLHHKYNEQWKTGASGQCRNHSVISWLL